MDRVTTGQPRLLQGNEAMVEGAVYAGCRFFAGYPITPATEISEAMSYRLPAVDGTFIQMEDEIASMGAVIGASLAGVKAMTATSGPGFCHLRQGVGRRGEEGRGGGLEDVQSTGLVPRTLDFELGNNKL